MPWKGNQNTFTIPWQNISNLQNTFRILVRLGLDPPGFACGDHHLRWLRLEGRGLPGGVCSDRAWGAWAPGAVCKRANPRTDTRLKTLSQTSSRNSLLLTYNLLVYSFSQSTWERPRIENGHKNGPSRWACAPDFGTLKPRSGSQNPLKPESGSQNLVAKIW